MKKIEFQLKFLDYWHLSSGDSAGSMYDSIVTKDINGLPYVPGKTIKGLAREFCEKIDKKNAKTIFGEEGDKIANSYFSNATLSGDEVEYLNYIGKRNLKKHLFSKISQTRIDENGVAVDKSLRQLEVVIPLVLHGFIETNEEELIIKSLKSIKQMGLNRNRGLGRCEFEIIKGGFNE